MLIVQKSLMKKYLKLTLEIPCDSNIDEDLVIKKVIKMINDIEPGLDIKVLRDEKINNKKVEIALGGLNCAHCGEEIGNKVSKLDNVLMIQNQDLI